MNNVSNFHNFIFESSIFFRRCQPFLVPSSLASWDVSRAGCLGDEDVEVLQWIYHKRIHTDPYYLLQKLLSFLGPANPSIPKLYFPLPADLAIWNPKFGLVENHPKSDWLCLKRRFCWFKPSRIPKLWVKPSILLGWTLNRIQQHCWLILEPLQWSAEIPGLLWPWGEVQGLANASVQATIDIYNKPGPQLRGSAQAIGVVSKTNSDSPSLWPFSMDFRWIFDGLSPFHWDFHCGFSIFVVSNASPEVWRWVVADSHEAALYLQPARRVQGPTSHCLGFGWGLNRLTV